MQRFCQRAVSATRAGQSNSVFIRPALIEDVPAILKVERVAETATHWTEGKYLGIFEQETPRRIALVAEDESGVHGFGVIQLLHQECEIENLVVVSGMRRQGVGNQLLCSLIEVARNHGAAAVFLEVRDSNEAARELYNGAGFSESGRRKGYYHSPEEDAILYRL